MLTVIRLSDQSEGVATLVGVVVYIEHHVVVINASYVGHYLRVVRVKVNV